MPICWIICYWVSWLELKISNEIMRIEVNTNLLFGAVVALIAVSTATLWSIQVFSDGGSPNNITFNTFWPVKLCIPIQAGSTKTSMIYRHILCCAKRLHSDGMHDLSGIENRAIHIKTMVFMSELTYVHTYNHLIQMVTTADRYRHDVNRVS